MATEKAKAKKGFDPAAYMKSLLTPKAKKAVVPEKTVSAPRASGLKDTKKVKTSAKLTKRDRARNKKIAKGNKAHGHGRK